MTVNTRNVYFFSGFDPRGTGYYYRLFRTELRKSGYAVGSRNLGSHHSPDALSPRIAVTSPGGQTNLNLFLMKWDDIVRRHWLTSGWALLVAGLKVYRAGLMKIPLGKVWQISHGAFWAGLLPVLLPLMMLLVLTLFFGVATSLVDLAAPAGILTLHASAQVFTALGLALAFTGATFSFVAEKTGVLWLIRIFRFNLLLANGRLPDLDERQRAWVESILRRQLENPSEEVVLLGHSVGTILLTEVARQLADDPRWRSVNGNRPTKILTLGNCIPFVSLHPDADSFRDTLRKLSQSEAIEWWDVTAKVDPLCFYLSSPMGEAGKQAAAGKPVLHVARFFRMYEPQRWKRMRRNKLELHFLYLRTPDIDRDFNLYRLICSATPFDVPPPRASHA